jgi:hypothetical protein
MLALIEGWPYFRGSNRAHLGLNRVYEGYHCKVHCTVRVSRCALKWIIILAIVAQNRGSTRGSTSAAVEEKFLLTLLSDEHQYLVSAHLVPSSVCVCVCVCGGGGGHTEHRITVGSWSFAVHLAWLTGQIDTWSFAVHLAWLTGQIDTWSSKWQLIICKHESANFGHQLLYCWLFSPCNQLYCKV